MKKKTVYFYLFPIYVFILGAVFVTAIIGSRTLTVFTENATIHDRKCVIIDAGHGGVDGGATSCTGVLESEINLQIALKLDDLMHLLGIKTIMIRTTDCSVYVEGTSIAAKKVSDLKQRVRIINNTENALLLSIHQNYFSDSRYSGAQVFYADTDNSSMLARKLQSTFADTINKGSNRKAKKVSGIYLMDHINCTGVLVECGFLSNPNEEANLRSPQYQNKICSVLACVSSCYLYNMIA